MDRSCPHGLPPKAFLWRLSCTPGIPRTFLHTWRPLGQYQASTDFPLLLPACVACPGAADSHDTSVVGWLSNFLVCRSPMFHCAQLTHAYVSLFVYTSSRRHSAKRPATPGLFVAMLLFFQVKGKVVVVC
jgi:hypothetical protein